MKDWFMFPIMLAVFAFGFYIVYKLDSFIAENQRIVETNKHIAGSSIHIAAETPLLLDDITTTLNYCTDTTPFLEFDLSYGTCAKMLRRLADGTLDIALLTEDSAKDLDSELSFIHIPRRKHSYASAFGASVKDLEAESDFAVVWNESIISKNRDRVIFMIETDLCAIK